MYNMSRNIVSKYVDIKCYKSMLYKYFRESQPQEMNACNWDFWFEKMQLRYVQSRMG